VLSYFCNPLKRPIPHLSHIGDPPWIAINWSFWALGQVVTCWLLQPFVFPPIKYRKAELDPLRFVRLLKMPDQKNTRSVEDE
jgi:hypothetical protein